MSYIIGLLLIVVFLLLQHVVVPWRKQKWYVQQFKKSGYKVLEVPFKPLGLGFTQIYDLELSTKDSLLKCKEQYSHYDVAVMNAMNYVFVDLIHPNLQQEFSSSESLNNFQKAKGEIRNISRATGVGLVASEGKEWKVKRKVLTEVFNYNFLKALTPRIAELADEAIEKMEKLSKGDEIEYDVHDLTIALAGDVMLVCFSGRTF